MINVTPKNPLAGAAYQILYEKWHPHFVQTREQQAAVLNEFDLVYAWASLQPAHVERAYKWALKELEKAMELGLQAREIGLAVHGHLQTIPRPPNAVVLPPPAALSPAPPNAEAAAEAPKEESAEK